MKVVYVPEQVDKVHENRVRRMAERQGFKLQKSRRRDPRAIASGYQLVDLVHGALVLGNEHFGYGITLDEVERFLTSDR